MIRNTTADMLMEEILICGEIKINGFLPKNQKKISIWKNGVR